MRSLGKKSWRNGDITLLLTDVGNLCTSHELLTSQLVMTFNAIRKK